LYVASVALHNSVSVGFVSKLALSRTGSLGDFGGLLKKEI
jgi:hypothetical protein